MLAENKVSHKKHILILLSLPLVAALFWLALWSKFAYKPLPGVLGKYLDFGAKANQLPAGLSSRALIKVPFTSQAPKADWSMPYQEACEESAVLMVDYFFKRKTFTPNIANAEILKVVDWQNKVLGDYVHTNVAQTVRMIKEYFGYSRVRVLQNVTADDIRAEIRAGHPVILPTAGRMLGNKYFHQPGPIYHMIVVTGFNGRQFITNDSGTKRGEGYVYSEKVLMAAIHDWTGDDATITKGHRLAIVIDGK